MWLKRQIAAITDKMYIYINSRWREECTDENANKSVAGASKVSKNKQQQTT